MSFTVTITQAQLNYKTDKDAQKMHNVYLYLKYLDLIELIEVVATFKTLRCYMKFVFVNKQKSLL